MKTRKLLSGISVLICCFCFCIPSLAANTDASSQSVVGIDTLGYVDSIDVTFSDLLSNSIITYADSEVMSGHYNGDSTVLWVEIGGVGTLTDFDWTQTIEFDWTAKVNSSGDYIFDKITNANSSMSPDLHLLYFDVESKELRINTLLALIENLSPLLPPMNCLGAIIMRLRLLLGLQT